MFDSLTKIETVINVKIFNDNLLDKPYSDELIDEYANTIDLDDNLQKYDNVKLNRIFGELCEKIDTVYNFNVKNVKIEPEKIIFGGWYQGRSEYNSANCNNIVFTILKNTSYYNIMLNKLSEIEFD